MFFKVACGWRGRVAEVTAGETGSEAGADLGGSTGRRRFLRPAITSKPCVPTVTRAESEFGKTFLEREREGGRERGRERREGGREREREGGEREREGGRGRF